MDLQVYTFLEATRENGRGDSGRNNTNNGNHTATIINSSSEFESRLVKYAENTARPKTVKTKLSIPFYVSARAELAQRETVFADRYTSSGRNEQGNEYRIIIEVAPHECYAKDSSVIAKHFRYIYAQNPQKSVDSVKETLNGLVALLRRNKFCVRAPISSDPVRFCVHPAMTSVEFDEALRENAFAPRPFEYHEVAPLIGVTEFRVNEYFEIKKIGVNSNTPVSYERMLEIAKGVHISKTKVLERLAMQFGVRIVKKHPAVNGIINGIILPAPISATKPVTPTKLNKPSTKRLIKPPTYNIINCPSPPVNSSYQPFLPFGISSSKQLIQSGKEMEADLELKLEGVKGFKGVKKN